MKWNYENFRGPLRLLTILALINFINFADRLVIVPLFPLLRDYFQVSDGELGSLQTVLQVVLALATIPFALWADRIDRTRVISAGVIIWSVATFFTGLAPTFGLLLLTRAMVGIGEAAYGPAAQSMISGAFSAEMRARAQAVFAAGMLIGGTAGQALGGILGEYWGWRPAFFLVGLPGIVLGMMVRRIPDPPKGPLFELVPIRRLLQVPAYLAMILSGTLITFAAVSFITWGPDFVVRYKGFGLAQAGVSLGVIGLISLVGGVLAGGGVADWLHKRYAYGRVLAVAIGFIVAAPFVVWALYAESKETVLIAFFIAGFFMSWYHGPVTAIIHDMMPRRAHATSVGVYMFVTQLVGAFGPQLVGQISDARDLRAGFQTAVGVMLAGAACFFLVIHFIRRHGLRHPALDAYRGED